ncbi:putative cyclin-A3-1 isoform X1 [Morus notabilis]|uniref:putative cyclin-A3-1 isoform X1 n=1 Tax=Morus notabilis TaxID=981085 RepID=UPI000CED2A60|nr:putative cyclin-A3-1 isoform X1 [Morus notabilis]
MEDKENCVRFTRAAKRRAAASATAEDQPAAPTKKRVVLGELTNISNAVKEESESSGVATQKKKRETKSKLTNISNAVKEESESSGVATQKKKRETKSKAKKALPMTKTVTTRQETKETEAKSEDPQMCVPYVSDVYEYLHQIEVDPDRRPLPDYMEKVQNDITPSMRGILIDWLVEVAEEYKLLSDTVYLTVLYMDRFLSLNALSRQKLQLLGVSSMLIASKYEEITPPRVEDFCYITDNTYTKEEAVKMEADILKSLKFELGSPTIKTFLRRFTSVAQESYKTPNLQLEFLCCYLAELSLLDYNCVKFIPSLMAASVIFLARFTIRPKMHPWTPSLQKYSRYAPSDLKQCVLILHDLYLSRRGGSLQSVRAKYNQHKYKCVANMASPPEIPAHYFEDLRQ